MTAVPYNPAHRKAGRTIPARRPAHAPARRGQLKRRPARPGPPLRPFGITTYSQALIK
jgi:hypothetical protein